ncbi:MAG: OB-fold domain-containing protein [Actinomycetota bacterium]
MTVVSIAEDVLTLTDEGPVLQATVCGACGNHMFPIQRGFCQQCMSDDLRPTRLRSTGTLWSWTIQAFPPKSPPYIGDDDPATFRPYGVGYIELDGQLRLESRLTVAEPDQLRIGMAMRLTTVPIATNDDGDQVVTFAFAPVDTPDDADTPDASTASARDDAEGAGS